MRRAGNQARLDALPGGRRQRLDAATEIGHRTHVKIIPGGCPLRFEPVTGGGHEAMRFVLTLAGAVPRQV